MVNYQNGIIYRIYDNTNGDVYYGSTANVLRVRMGRHKSVAKSGRKCKSKSIILNDDYVYNEVEKYPCNSKKELETRERYYIENFTCVNKNVPTRTSKEYYEDNKEDIKQYYQDNKEDLKEYQIKYNQDHKEDIKQYYQDNKEEKQKKRNKYYADNKEELNMKHNCLCGGKYALHNKARHINTKKHQKYITDNTIVCIECK